MVRPVACRRLRRLAVAAAVLEFLVAIPFAHADCAHWNPVAGVSEYGDRQVTARDLIELVNIGRPDVEPLGGPSPFGLSGDGRWVAVVLQRADLASNGFCQALVLIDRRQVAPPRLLDRGGDFLLSSFSDGGHYDSNGVPRLNAARFSADGRMIAYLKRVAGHTRVWVAGCDGRAPVAVSPTARDVTRWGWRPNAPALVYAYDEGAAAADAAIDAEGLGGWHFDRRVAPMLGLRPQIAAPLPEAVEAVNPADGSAVPVLPSDRAALDADGDMPLGRHRAGAGGRAAWAERVRNHAFSPLHIEVRTGAGRAIPCSAAACTGHIAGLWWVGDGRTLVFLRTEGWNDRFTALYRWTPARGQPRRLLQTDDVIEGCQPTGGALVCTRQGAEQPPRLVAIDTGTGRQRLVFDPNPGFAALRLGRVERLEWRNDVGREVYGDLVLPPGYAGGRLPTIVVLYRSRGFLRGGTGNDYPIQLFAKRGFAVLSIGRPALFAEADPTIGDDDAFWQENTRDWADRRSVDSAIEAGLDLLVARGVADPARLALTGLSDGSSSVRFALIRSRRYAAAAISTCCVDESSDDVVGPGWVSESARLGYPPAAPVDEKFWQPYSLALNAPTMTTPLLMQLADSELLSSLHGYAALDAAKQPVDLYFFPGEYHFKWQPAHRQAVYDRNLDWFSFWLQNAEDPAPAKAAQFARWRALRDRLPAKHSP
jgi:dipeptidyl aminopeptidase/acylaminoacyl peptidase